MSRWHNDDDLEHCRGCRGEIDTGSEELLQFARAEQPGRLRFYNSHNDFECLRKTAGAEAIPAGEVTETNCFGCGYPIDPEDETALTYHVSGKRRFVHNEFECLREALAVTVYDPDGRAA